MATLFVTRHSGAAEWAARQGLAAEIVAHLDLARVSPGDLVLGTLPVSLAAEVCARGARYFHLTLAVPPELRGQELSADDMARLGARLEEFIIRRV